jgi:hypothetical protein
VCGFWYGIMDGEFCICMGCVKFGMCCRHFRNSIRRVPSKYGNVSCKSSKVDWFSVINEYSLSCTMFDGFIRSGLLSQKFWRMWGVNCGGWGSCVSFLIILFVHWIVFGVITISHWLRVLANVITKAIE